MLGTWSSYCDPVVGISTKVATAKGLKPLGTVHFLRKVHMLRMFRNASHVVNPAFQL